VVKSQDKGKTMQFEEETKPSKRKKK